MSNATLPRGPKLPAILQASQYYLNPYHYLRKCAKRYGDTFTMRLPGFSPIVIMSEPEMVKQIFTENADVLTAGKVNRVYFGESLGKYSLLNLDGKPHMRHRKLILPPLHGSSLDQYAKTMIQITQAVTSTWKEGKIIKMLPEFKRITLRIIMRVVYGLEESDTLYRLEKLITQLMEVGGKPYISYLVGLFPGLLNHPAPRIKKLFSQVDEIILQLIKDKRQTPSQNDVISIYLNARDEEGQPLGAAQK